MAMTNFRQSLSSVLLVVLIAAMALLAVGCGDIEKPQTSEKTEAVTSTAIPTSVTYLGYGEHVFELTVTDYDGNNSYFHIHTDKETVGEALMELGLIDGDEGEFGLYVKYVNDIRADYDKDGKYWAFYIDGEYAMTGAELTPIEDGKTYSFKVE